MPTVVITGCNSGIGNAWAQILLKEGHEVYALDIQKGPKLLELEGPKCKTFQVDVTSPQSIAVFKKALGDTPVDVLLNIAGIMPTKEKDTLEDLGLPMLEQAFSINTYGPFLLTQALIPNLLAAPAPRRLAVMSSRVGSIADNSTGGYYSYRASKTAVNSIFKSLAVELKDKDVIVLMMHPGFTKTNLDKDIWKIQGAEEANVPAERLWKLVQEKGIEDTGKFWHRDGFELAW